MVILGIDPGLALVGWGVIEKRGYRFCPVAYGAIRTPPKTAVETRLEMIYEELGRLIEKYRPDEMAVEELFFNSNQTTGIAVAEARGVILLCARQHGLNLGEYTPLQVKQAVVGYGRADKRQVMAMVTSLLGLRQPPKPDDTADALAIALCHGQSAPSPLMGYIGK
ncbi:MAG: crossover junction endodeoxyribonuclease RuvC [Eubacteriales bacterium]